MASSLSSPSTSSLLPPSDANRTGDKRLRDYLAEEVHNELWEGQVEATKKKQRERRKEESIIEWGVQYPATFLSLLLPPFLEPSTRLPISALLVHFLQANPSLSSFLADSELLDALLTSLQLDTSTTVFQLQVTILQVTLTGAPAALASRLPEVFVILARAICWKERHHLLDGDEGDPGGSGISVMRALQPLRPAPSQRRQSGLPASDDSDSEEEEASPPKKALDWKRLDFSFDSAPAPPPDTFPLLSYLYYVWPCNVLGFLRDPAKYLHEKDRLTNIEGKEWEEVFDRQEVGDRSKALLRQLTIHPDILLFDAKSELLDHRKYKLSPREIITNTSLLRVVAPPPAEPLLRSTPKLGRDGVSSVVPRPYDELVAERKEFTFRKIEDDRKRRLGQVEYLTREVLMLENELMFEVYLKNFYIAHNKRLHQDVKLGAGALSEQQAFRNLLKNHEQTNETLQTELRKLKERADTEKTNTKAKRDADLAKYTRTKETLDKMTAQLTPLRNELQLVKEDRDRTKAELAEVKNERFDLQNQLREIQPEVDAIHDFKEKIMKLEMVGKAAQGDRRVRRQQEEAIQEFDGKILAVSRFLSSPLRTNAF
ncbi:hypothetical protein BDY24DRAFT_132146 [Mrakia frigida]|uniref:uncharacterized protein n=1 Tax=Mrakia frigida TaxID=29902 RepID=UPI003FCC1A03